MEREQGRAAPRADPGTHEPYPQDLRDLKRLPTRDLVGELARTASQMARKEIELAKEEVRADIRAEIKMASGLGVAGVCALVTLTLLLVAIAFALMESGALSGWLATLILAAVVLAIGTVAGLWGWAKRVRQPLATTRHSMKENVRWAKDRIA
jgi:uncharacterized membrane protein YqjE